MLDGPIDSASMDVSDPPQWPEGMEWMDHFDFWENEEHQRSPYDHYRQLRQHRPVARSEALGGYWLLTNFHDIETVLRDQANFSSAKMTLPYMPEPAGPRIPLSLDAPEHLPYRRMLMPLFTPGMALDMEPLARQFAGELLDGVDNSGPVDFVEAFAVPFPQQVLLTWLGVPESGFQLLADLDVPIRRSTHDSTFKEAAFQARVEADRYFTDLVETRSATGPIGPDLLSYLVEAKVNDRPLTLNEVQRILMLMYSAGLHTTAASVANVVWYLAGHHELRDRLTKDPSLIAVAVEELMRWESIVSMRRTAVSDVEIGGCPIKAGDPVILFLGSAGRDEEVHNRGEEVDIDRPSYRHLNFGAGAHRCLGSHFARMELRVALEVLHARFPRYAIAQGTSPVHHTGIERGLSELWIDLEAA